MMRLFRRRPDRRFRVYVSTARFKHRGLGLERQVVELDARDSCAAIRDALAALPALGDEFDRRAVVGVCGPLGVSSL